MYCNVTVHFTSTKPTTSTENIFKSVLTYLLTLKCQTESVTRAMEDKRHLQYAKQAKVLPEP